MSGPPVRYTVPLPGINRIAVIEVPPGFGGTDYKYVLAYVHLMRGALDEAEKVIHSEASK